MAPKTCTAVFGLLLLLVLAGFAGWWMSLPVAEIPIPPPDAHENGASPGQKKSAEIMLPTPETTAYKKVLACAPPAGAFVLYVDLKPGRTKSFMRHFSEGDFFGLSPRRLGLAPGTVNEMLLCGDEARDAALVLLLEKEVTQGSIINRLKKYGADSTEEIVLNNEPCLKITFDTVNGLKTHVLWMPDGRTLVAGSAHAVEQAVRQRNKKTSAAADMLLAAKAHADENAHGFGMFRGAEGRPDVLLSLVLAGKAALRLRRHYATTAEAERAAVKIRADLLRLRGKLVLACRGAGHAAEEDLARVAARAVTTQRENRVDVTLAFSSGSLTDVSPHTLLMLINFFKEK